MLRRYFFILFFLGCSLSPQRVQTHPIASSSSQAQQTGENRIAFEHLSVDDGLSNAFVWTMMQDGKGFLWFGTAYGLNRFDGYRFTVFSHQGSGMLSDNTVRALFEDHSGQIWIGTLEGGLNRFDPATQKFTAYQHDPNDANSLSANHVRVIHESPREPGILWIGTYGGGLNRLDVNRGTFSRYRHDPNNPNSLPNDFIWAICEDRAGDLWIGTTGGLARAQREIGKANESTLKFTNYQHHATDPNSLSDSYVTSIIEDRSGALWIGTNDAGICRLDKQTGKFFNYRHDPNNANSLSNNSILSIFEDKTGYLWIGTYGGGLNRMQIENSKKKKEKDGNKQESIDPSIHQSSDAPIPRSIFTRYLHNPDDPTSLSHNVVRNIYRDRSGILWVATWGGGLNKFYKRKFKTFRHEPNNANSLIRNNVTAIWEASSSRENVLLIGTEDGGLSQMKSENGDQTRFKHFQFDSRNPKGLSDNYVTAIHESRNEPEVFWIGTFNAGLNRFDRKSGAFERYGFDSYKPNSLPDKRIASLHESLRKPGVFWIGTDDGGLVRMNLSEGKNPKFTGVAIGQRQTGDSHLKVIRSIYESLYLPGVLWIGVDHDGLLKLELDGNEDVARVTQFKHQPAPQGLTGTRVYAICVTRDSVLWVGTNGGLNKLVPSRDTEAFVYYSKSNGLPSESVHGILEDGDGNLWLSTDNGLSKFDRKTGTFRNYSASDGLQSNQFRWGVAHKGRGGKMYFGGINGFTVFHPDSIKDNPHVPPVVFTDFKIFNQSVEIDAESGFVLPAHISETDEVVLSHRENVFSFEFAALDFTNSGKNLYSYKMENFDENWSAPGYDHRATYTNLDPGKYTFRVKGSNNDGIWNETGASVKVTILPPWWQTLWAYGFYGLFIGAALYVLRRYEMNRQQLKHDAELRQMEAKKLQEVDSLKSRFFANISHEFRTPLTLILGHTEGALHESEKQSAKDKLKIVLRNTSKLRALINQLLDLSKFEAGRMELKASQQDIVPVLRAAIAAFESHAAQKEITLTFSTKPDAIPVYFEKEQIEKVMYNLLSNALKFTPKGGEISVQLSVISNQ